MAALKTLSIDKSRVKSDLRAFKALLDDPNRPVLKEREDILPFFRARPHLCGFIGSYNSYIVNYRSLGVAVEFDIFGDFTADLVVGDTTNREYCFIEFENAGETSLFKKTPRQTPEWSTRFEHGFSQLVDWILWLENNKGNAAFVNRFGVPSIRYNMLLVIGREKHLSRPGLGDRLNWRTDQVVVASKKFHCITFDKLYEDLALRVEILGG